MKHFLIKFNHGVEIGARLAYLGHYKRTKNPRILEIANDELRHRETLEYILVMDYEKPSIIIDGFFTVVGNGIRIACAIAPNWSLDFIARTMELFAVFNYRKLARQYPHIRDIFTEMADKEEEHERFFSA